MPAPILVESFERCEVFEHRKCRPLHEGTGLSVKRLLRSNCNWQVVKRGAGLAGKPFASITLLDQALTMGNYGSGKRHFVSKEL